MRRWMAVVLLTWGAVSPAPNEAGGDWLANRVKARAYDMLSVLCQRTESDRGMLSYELLDLERRVGETAFKDLLDAKDHRRWEYFLAHDVDVYRTLLEKYLRLGGRPDAKAIAARTDFSSLVTRGVTTRTVPTLRIGDTLWKAVPGVFSATEAAAQCERLDPAIGAWRLPSAQEMTFQVALLRNYVDRLPYKRPENYVVHVKDGAFDMIDGLKLRGAEEGGVICEVSGGER